jgi:hypothetical protein
MQRLPFSVPFVRIDQILLQIRCLIIDFGPAKSRCHRSGPNLDATPNDIIRRIERYSGVKLAKAFSIPDLDREVKWDSKYARQNGIHVSPIFMIDGLVQADMSSGDRGRLGVAPVKAVTVST